MGNTDLAVGVYLFHKRQKNKCKIIKIDGMDIVVKLPKPLPGCYKTEIQLKLTDIGEYLFFEIDEIGLSQEVLKKMSKYKKYLDIKMEKPFEKNKNELTRYIRGIYDVLRPKVINGNPLCDLEDINKNYDSLLCQQLYFLRYVYAYAHEYKRMYEKTLNYFNTYTIKVLSIGCGCGVDYLSLVEALKNTIFVHKRIIYDGVDPISWDFKFAKLDERNMDLVNYHQYTIEDYISNINFILDYDIIILPKSLTDLKSSGSFVRLKKAFERCVLNRKTTLILGSFPSDEEGSFEERLKEDFIDLINCFKKKNSLDLRSTISIKRNNSYIHEHDNSFKEYPKDVKSFLKQGLRCNVIKCRKQKETHCDYFHNPVITCKYMSNMIIVAERKI